MALAHMNKTLAEKWEHIFQGEGGQWPQDNHWPEQWVPLSPVGQALDMYALRKSLGEAY